MLNLAIGPVMMENEILAVGSEQIPYFRTEEFSELMLENERMLLKLINAPQNSRNIFLTASGTAAMEATVTNVLSKNDKVLVINGGSFGKRFKEICDIHELDVDEIKLEFFEQITMDHLTPHEGKGFTALLINVHETSTGVLYDMDVVKDFCRRNNLLLIVDAISSFLADHYDMKSLGASVTILSSQKALALPPGMSFVVLDSVAQERIMQNSIKCLYFNFKNYLKDGLRGQTPYTPAVSVLIQLNKRLKSIQEQGLDQVINNVELIAKDFRNRIGNLPLEIPSEAPSNALTPIICKGTITAQNLFRQLKNDYNIFIVPSGGNLADRLLRVGHIGSVEIKDNIKLVEALKSIMEDGIS